MKEEKQLIIDSAMAKLTEEEKKALGLIKEPKKPKEKKSYKLKVYYMIGDADGHTDTEETISAKNPFLPLVTRALDKLKVCKGSWGLQLSEEDYSGNLSDKNITEQEHDLLCLVSGYGCNDSDADEYLEESGFDVSEENYEFLNEFQGLFIDDTEYSFLVYKGYKLK